MMRLALASVSIAAIMFGSIPVQAGERGVFFDWTGFYLGAHGAFAHVENDARYTGGTTGNFDVNYDGGVFGALLGYGMQDGQWVYGLEADVGIPVDLSSSAQPVQPSGSKITVNGHARARAGFLINESTLLFGAVGAAFAEHKATLVPAPLNPVVTQSEFIAGLSVGGGIEHAFNDFLKFRIEYIYDHYFRQKVFSGGTFGGVAGFPNQRSEIGMHTVRGVISIDLY